MKFYIDSAIPDDIEFALKKMYRGASKSLHTFGGITTNPSALSKAGITTYAGMLAHLKVLDALLQKWWEKTLSQSEIHVQIPLSTMSSDAANIFVEDVLNQQLKSSCIFKFPPIPQLVFNSAACAGVRINITGLSSIEDCTHALMWTNVRYASLITGRMADVGMDVAPHFVRGNLLSKEGFPGRYIIAGSMRTPAQVLSAASARMLPTIGRKVWDQMTKNDCKELIICMADAWTDTSYPNERLVPIPSDERAIKLTNDFFIQMDILGRPIFETFAETKINQYNQKFL